MARWMINCRDYAVLASHCMDRRLSTWERISMKLHQWLCPPCHEVQVQFDAIRQACRWTIEEDRGPQPGDARLSDEARSRLKASLKQIPK